MKIFETARELKRKMMNRKVLRRTRPVRISVGRKEPAFDKFELTFLAGLLLLVGLQLWVIGSYIVGIVKALR